MLVSVALAPVLACGGPARDDGAPTALPSTSTSSAPLPPDVALDLSPVSGPRARELVFEELVDRRLPLRIDRERGSLRNVPAVPIGVLSEGAFFVHDVEYAVFVGDDQWVLAETASGLWLHEGATLVRRARLAPPPILALTASAKGDRFAFVTGSGRSSAVLHVFDFASRKKLASFDVPRPKRIRMSRDGTAIAIASQSGEQVALADVSTGAMRRFDVNDEVNDAIPLDGHPGQVAYVTDSDDTFVRDMIAGKELYDSVGTHGAGYPTRDQNGVAYDAATDRLFSSGEDNAVWTYEGWRSGGRRASRSADYAGDVDEIVFAGGEIVAALDSIAVVRDHAGGARVGPFGDRTFSDPARVSVGASGALVMALDGRLARWDGTAREILVAPDTVASATTRVHRGGRATYLQVDRRLFAATPSEGIEASVAPTELATHTTAWPFRVVELAEADVLVALDPPRVLCELRAAAGARVASYDHAGEVVDVAASHDGKALGVLTSTGQVIVVGADGAERERLTLEAPAARPGRPPFRGAKLVSGPTGWKLKPGLGF